MSGPNLNLESLTTWAAIFPGSRHLRLSEVYVATNALNNIDFRDGLIARLTPGAPLDLLPVETQEIIDLLPAVVTDGLIERLTDLADSIRPYSGEDCAAVLPLMPAYAWLTDGDADTAGEALGRALALRPDYRLALLLVQMVQLNFRVTT